MAFLKTAKFDHVEATTLPSWDRKIRVASKKTPISSNVLEQASDILGENFTPENYLLSHATIVCSVDTESPPNSKTGKIEQEGVSVNRKYSDYWIKNNTEKYINQNKDAWSRGVLTKSYETFIGAHNFVEHVQMLEHSKGKIVDAVLRDIGDSLYVDILVATNRKHKSLVKDILAKKIKSMSMGCSVDETICTKCGHVGVDEVDMCSHVRYSKGNKYYDEHGNVRVIAELCGHESLNPNGGVNFIEASWVNVPAFMGAELRNILDIQNINSKSLKNAQKILSNPPSKWVSKDDLKDIVKAASFLACMEDTRSKMAFDFGDDEEEEGEEGGESKGDNLSKLKNLENDIVEFVTKGVEDRIKKEMQGDADLGGPKDGSKSTISNDNVKSAHPLGASMVDIYRLGLNTLARTASCNKRFLQSLQAFNYAYGVHVSKYLYQVSHAVGPSYRYASLGDFSQACGRVLRRRPNHSELKTLIRISKLLSVREQHNH